MKGAYTKLISIVCIVFLVVSSAGPSLAMAADTATDKTISIQTASETQQLESVTAFIQTETNGNLHYQEFRSDWSDASKLVIESYFTIDASEEYLFTWQATYREGDQVYHYFDEVLMSGAEILTLGELKIPAAAELKQAVITNDLEIEHRNLDINVGTGEKYYLSEFYIGYDQTNHILVKKDSQFPLSYSLEGFEEIDSNGSPNIYLYDEVDFSKENKISEDLQSLVPIQFETTVEDVFISKEGDQSSFRVEKKTKLSPGKYNISYEVNGSKWNGQFVADTNNNVITLPEVPNEIEIRDMYTYSDSEDYSKVNASYQVIGKNGNFELSSYYGDGSKLNLSTKIYNGETLVAENAATEQTNLNYNYQAFDLGKNPSGKYNLVVELKLDEEQSVTDSVEFAYESPWQELKGAIITAKNTAGEVLDDLEVTLYEKAESYFEEVITETASNGEVFIPNTYILKDKPYVLVATSQTDKTAYVQEFIGQSTNEFNFDGISLKSLDIKLGDLETLISQLRFADSNNPNAFLNLSFITNDWKMSVSDSLVPVLYWEGESADGIGYTYENIVDFEKGVDLTKAEWLSYKPDSKYADAFLSLNKGAVSGYKEIKGSFSELFNRPTFYMSVKDNGNRYSGLVESDGQKPVTFGEYTGSAVYRPDNNIATYYNANGFGIDIEGSDISFTYELKSSTGEVQELVTNSHYMIPLTETLAEGQYTLTLKEASVNSEIVSLTMVEQPLVVAKGTPTSELPTTIPVAAATPYGNISNNYSGDQLAIYEKLDNGNYYSQIAVYSYNATKNEYDLNFENSSFKANATYMVAATISTASRSTSILEVREMTGQEIAALTVENPFAFSDNLKKLTFDVSSVLPTDTSFDGVLYFDDDLGIALRFNNNTGNKELYVSPGSYSAYLNIDSEETKTFIDIPAFELTGEKEITVSPSDLASIQVKNNNKQLPIFGFNRNYYSYNQFISKVDVLKGTYDYFRIGVGMSDKYDTPWGYMISKDNVVISDDMELNFSGEIEGEISSVDVSDQDWLTLSYNLTSGEYDVDTIFHMTKQSWGPSYPHDTASEDSIDGQPIRLYYGLFNSLNSVDVNYTIKDANGNEVQSGNIGSNRYVHLSFDHELPNGVYTMELNIPTGPRKSLKLTKDFTIGGPSISIDSPTDGAITNDDKITVRGVATGVEEVSVSLKKDDTTVDTKTAAVTEDGDFSVDFTPTEEGKYTVVVTSGETTVSKHFTIDRTAPAKAANITLDETTAGIQVKWDAVEDAKGYIVEVAEGTDEFVASSLDTKTTFTIDTVKPGTEYKVRVRVIDEAGNESISDVATYSIAEFVTTAISISDKRNTNSLLEIGDELAIYLDGSYKEGYAAKAVVTIDEKETPIDLTYNETTKKYEGSLKVEAGMKAVQSIKGYIVDGESKTNEKTQELNWNVGSTITGTVTDGAGIKDATVRFKSKDHSYSVKTTDEGTFSLAGIAAGTYTVSVSINGKTATLESAVEVVVGASEVKDDVTIQIQAVVNPVISIVDSIDSEAVQDGLRVRVAGANGFISYGTTENGKYEPYSGYSLTNLPTGKYKVTVYGEGFYSTTTSDVEFKKGTTDYTVFVLKEDVETKDITIKLTGENIEQLDSISLYSYSVSEMFDYSGVGSYYDYDVKVENNQVTFEDVVVAEDYNLYISLDGFMSYSETVDLTDQDEISVSLEKGREVSGKISDSNGPLGFVNVFAYAGNTYYNAYTDGEGNYTLQGLSKDDAIQINVYSEGHLDYSETVAKGTEDITDQNIVLSKAMSLTGKVVDKDGNPISHASVSVSSKTPGEYSYGWARTATDGTFSVNGLKDTTEYVLSISDYGYPTLTVDNPTEGATHILQKEGDGEFFGDGNFLAASKSTVVPGDSIEFTLSYQNNGEQKATNVPVSLTLPTGLTLVENTVQLNGSVVSVDNGQVTIPSVEAGESGKLKFEAKVSSDIDQPSLTATAKVTEDGAVLSASTSVVFVTLSAPAQTGTKSVKVYGSAKLGSNVEVYANNKLVGQAKVDSKWWYADIKLPVADVNENEEFTITAKVTNGTDVANSKPAKITYTPDVPTIEDVTVHAGWNGDVKLNPYTGVATFAITEHTPLDTTIKFNQEVDSAALSFLGKTYEMTKGSDNAFTFDGTKLGNWTSYGEQLLEVTFKKGDVEVTLPLMNIIVLIDPSGYVFEGSMANKLEGVQAIVETRASEKDPWVQWDAAKFGQVNPQVTDAEGRYGWDVIEGEWRVIFSKEGYEPYISRSMSVPPAETELNVPMVKSGDPAVTTSTVDEDHLTVAFDRYMNVSSAAIKLYEVTEDGNVEVDGTVNANNALTGYKSIPTPAEKVIGFAGKDSKGQDGFFAADDSKQVATSFTFEPASSLKAGTDYVLVINEDINDAENRELGNAVNFAFTTEAAVSVPDGNGSGDPTPAPGGGGGSVVTPPAGEVTDVDLETIQSQLGDSSKKEVEVKAKEMSAQAPNVQVSVAKQALEQVAGANKNFVIQSGDVKIAVPAEVLSQIAKSATKEVTFNVSLVKDSKVPGNGETLSDVYEFTITTGDKTISAFETPIVITLPVTSKVKDADKVAAYYINEKTKELEFVISKYENGAVTFKTNHFSQFVVVENNKTFKDVPTNQWAKQYIDSLAAKQIVNGKTADTFAPNDSITRSQFALILTRVLNLPTTEYEGKFSDVPESMDWAASEIEAANRAGIVTGSNGSFKPYQNITRQQMAAMIVRALEYVDPSIVEGVKNDVKYADAKSIHDYAKEPVSIVSGLGIVSGRTENGKQLFAPTENATRAQAAKMLYNMLDYLAE